MDLWVYQGGTLRGNVPAAASVCAGVCVVNASCLEMRDCEKTPLLSRIFTHSHAFSRSVAPTVSQRCASWHEIDEAVAIVAARLCDKLPGAQNRCAGRVQCLYLRRVNVPREHGAEWAIATSNCKIKGHFSIQNHHPSGGFSPLFLHFQQKIQKKVGI